MEKLHLLYLLGLDRSGSTITGLILGEHQNVVYHGELQYHAKAMLEQRILAEGVSINHDPFWQPIRQQLEEELGEDVFRRYMAVAPSYERWRYLARLLVHYLRKDKKLWFYWQYNEILNKALIKAGDGTILCDSSKNMLRRFALSLSGRYSFSTIYILRDVRAYCWSRKKNALTARPVGWLAMIAYSLKWMGDNLLFSLASWLGGFTRVYYEELCLRPRHFFDDIKQALKLDFSKPISIVEDKMKISTVNVIAGSRSIRKRPSTYVQLDETWREHLSTQEKGFILLLAGWLLFLFGYPVKKMK